MSNDIMRFIPTDEQRALLHTPCTNCFVPMADPVRCCFDNYFCSVECLRSMHPWRHPLHIRGYAFKPEQVVCIKEERLRETLSAYREAEAAYNEAVKEMGAHREEEAKYNAAVKAMGEASVKK